jgi:phytoene dehydrogenase-like protein
MSIPAKLPIDLMSLGDKLRLIGAMSGAGGVLSKLGRLSCAEYARRYRSPVLREFFSTRMPRGEDSFSSFVFSVGTFSSGNGAIPVGGSRAMARRMEATYRALGGRVVTGAQVEEIVVQGGRATGLRLAGQGAVVLADYVIAACDVHVTFDTLLGGKYRDPAFDVRDADPDAYPAPTSVQIALAADADLASYPRVIAFPSQPWTCGLTKLSGLGFKNFAFEPSFAPKGKGLLTVTVGQSEADYSWWERLAGDPPAYRAEKERVGRAAIERIVARFPELAGKLSVLDVATPHTYHRFTGAWRGAWMAWITTPRSKSLMHSGKIKGLPNCLLAGQWLMPPGGLPCAAVTGRYAAQRIAKLEGLPL